MSIPTNQLVYAGVWNNTASYPQYYFVLSPIDSLCYINISPTPVSGGSDPSVQPSTVWLLFPNVTGDITGVVASTGLSGGGTSGSVVIANAGVLSVGASGGCSSSGGQNPVISNDGVLTVSANNGCASTGGQNPTISNTGVLSLDGATGAINTKCGQYYKTSDQFIGGTAGPAITTTITFDALTSWTDTSALLYDAVNDLWTVLQHGVYHLQAQLNYADMQIPNFGDETHLININIGRNLVTDSPIRIAFDWNNASPQEPDQFVAGIYELQVGDNLQIQVVDHFQNTGQYRIKGQSSGANAFDYNTFFSWALIKPLP